MQKLIRIKKEERLACDASDLWRNGEHFFLFSDWKGKPINPSSVRTWWKRFITRHNLHYIKFHALRHTSASLLINDNVDIDTVSKRLGHSKTSTTANIYVHGLKSADKAAADRFDRYFEPKPNEQA
jgi:integrase